jgi:hypothetical protein
LVLVVRSSIRWSRLIPCLSDLHSCCSLIEIHHKKTFSLFDFLGPSRPVVAFTRCLVVDPLVQIHFITSLNDFDDTFFMPRGWNSPASRQLRVVTFKEGRIQRSEAVKYRKQIIERANQLPADRRAALIEAAEKTLKDIQSWRHPVRTPPSSTDKAALIQSAREAARAILTNQGLSARINLRVGSMSDILFPSQIYVTTLHPTPSFFPTLSHPLIARILLALF